jgi:hypothetical protein
MEKNKNDDAIRKSMEKAQELIKKKKFDDARALLITIDDPKAQEWLDRINQMSPATQTVIVQEKKKGGCVRNTLAILGGLFVCMIIALMIGDPDGNTSNTTNGTTGAGSRTNPYPAGSTQEIRDGRFRVNSIQEGMTDEVKAMNMFNTDPDTGQEWVLVDATFFCDLSADRVCNTTAMQFELVGSAGKAYNTELMAVLDRPFGGEVFGGGESTGVIGFIIDSDDSDFLLVIVDGGRKFFAIPE